MRLNKIKNILIVAGIVVLSMILVGCIDDKTRDITGTYSDQDNNKTTLVIYDNNTFKNTEIAGYLLGREVSFTVHGTYQRDGDMIIFSGDGVKTVAYVHGDYLIVEGSKYIRIEQ